MGGDIKFNWILKLENKDLENLVEGEERNFEKSDKRVYPIRNQIFLVDEEFKVKGVVQVRDFFINGDITSGKYRLIKIPSPEEEKVLSYYLSGMNIRGDF